MREHISRPLKPSTTSNGTNVMRSLLGNSTTLVCLCLAGLAARGSAQTTLHTQAAEITLSGRIHTQFNTTSVAGQPGSEFLIRRARLDAAVRLNDFVSGFVQPEYGQGKALLRLGYLRLDFHQALHATLGQFRRPFDLFQITSSTDILVVERTGDLRGVDSCAGVGGVCSFSRFTEQLQLGGPDIGVMLDGTGAHGRVAYAVSVANGTGGNVSDENGAKSFAARLTVSPSRAVRLAGNLAVHDYLDAISRRTAYATVLGADAEVGSFAGGFHLQAGAMTGANWRYIPNGTPARFAAAQAIATYKLPIHRAPYAEALEPVVRISWGDPDRSAAQDGGWLLTPGLVWHITGRNKLAANLDLWRPQHGSGAWGLKLQSYLFF